MTAEGVLCLDNVYVGRELERCKSPSWDAVSWCRAGRMRRLEVIGERFASGRGNPWSAAQGLHMCNLMSPTRHRLLWWLSLTVSLSACADPCLDDGLFQDAPQNCAVDEDPSPGSTGEEPAEESCFNGVKDSDEADADCGGVCAALCEVDQDCTSPDDCETGICGSSGTCTVPASCDDGVRDEGESDQDCGGVCGATCPIDAQCDNFQDCASLVCNEDSGLCDAPTCDDGAPNGSETDVDCGGPDCAPCPLAGECDDDSDCMSGLCDPGARVCVAEHCGNGESDADETDVDCGGESCAPCEGGESCDDGSDCQSTVCEAGTCTEATCDDGIANGDETDVDCGGDECNLCDDGEGCDVGEDCDSGLCDPQHHVCESETCTNGVLDDGETDIDCGGDSCAPCNDGEACESGSDCASNSCVSGTCNAPSCDDGEHNGTESDVDCGGDKCAPCDDGQSCVLQGDCESQVCLDEVCQPPSCSDGVQNGDESAVDCGGACGSTCEDGTDCNDDADCVSGVCDEDAGICAPASCDDGTLNGDETDVDCGGGDCDPCEAPGMCVVDGDCTSQICDDGTCAPATCRDGVVNGTETDVDCGGEDCGPCPDDDTCAVGSDCQSLVCTDDVCIPATCSDGVQNQDETDVDCGGATCDACDDGEGCQVAEDCVSIVCNPVELTCESALCSDGVLNGTETDVDCGGDACVGCDPTEDCVEDGDCLSLICDGATNTCTAPTCGDGVQNQDETDVDCGGDTCSPCNEGESCVDADDCVSVVCLALTCQPSECDDGVQNQDETDIDCGGDTCQPCGDGEDCLEADDCDSAVCDGGTNTCSPPTCSDGVENGDETDIDCGGSSCAACDDGEGCLVSNDCVSLVCDGGTNTCSAPTCSDGVENQDETDSDCGGSCGATCDTGEGCTDAGDCISTVCDGGTNTCAAPTCSDGVQNQGETDTDCGGPCGATCDTGETCNGAGDCTSLVCDGGTNTCSAPTCSDGVENQDETDTDCGGSCGNTCDTAEGCDDGGDCISGVCDGATLTCSAPTCFDGVDNGDETDIDCGGSCAATCDDGDGCAVAADCTSGVCDGVSDTCTAPSCADGVQNGDETGLDCGGSCGATCDTGASCDDGLDCVSGGCTAGACNPPLSVTISPNACGDASLGPITYTANPSGGTGGPYTYQWSPDDGTVSNPTAATTSVSPTDYASYQVTVDDGLNTITETGVVVYSAQPFNLQNNCNLYQAGFGGSNPATITYSAGGTVATENGNNAMGLHVCEEVSFTNVRLTGSAIVNTTQDDDWFGLIWGAQDSSHFYVMAWKQAPQTFFGCAGGAPSPAGIIIKRVFAPDFASITAEDMYCPNDTANSEYLMTPAETLSSGWLDNTPYTMEIEYRPTGSTISVTNDNTSTEIANFVMTDTTYASGYFGSHTVSQNAVEVGPLIGQCLD
ncbi:MAG: hypothetical protein CMP06_14605 [Xanthomonadales bacterium]|nr:hypothetical protein [Xanthomonadales bacterium]